MDNILSFLTSNNNSDNLPNKIPSRDVFLQTETYNKFTGGAEYNKDTYIGHLKLKNGGMKIVKSGDDNRIKKERNNVLEHLHKSLNGGKIDGGNLPTYYKALEGGYIRNLICPTDSKTCSNFIDNNKMAAYKLSKNALKNGYANTLKTFKENAPKLYKNLKDSDYIKKLKYKRDKYLNRLSDGGSAKSDGSLSEHLSNLRNNVGTRNLSETGGYEKYSRVKGVWEDQGTLGNATLGKLETARKKELDAFSISNKGKVKQLATPLGGYNLNDENMNAFDEKRLDDIKKELKALRDTNVGKVEQLSLPMYMDDNCYNNDNFDEYCKEKPLNSSDIYKKKKRRLSKEIRKLSEANKGNVRRLSSPASSPASSRASSPAPSPMSYENDRFYGGGDPLQELRMELGRL
jgi:hypothetical protein